MVQNSLEEWKTKLFPFCQTLHLVNAYASFKVCIFFSTILSINILLFPLPNCRLYSYGLYSSCFGYGFLLLPSVGRWKVAPRHQSNILYYVLMCCFLRCACRHTLLDLVHTDYVRQSFSQQVSQSDLNMNIIDIFARTGSVPYRHVMILKQSVTWSKNRYHAFSQTNKKQKTKFGVA